MLSQPGLCVCVCVFWPLRPSGFIQLSFLADYCALFLQTEEKRKEGRETEREKKEKASESERRERVRERRERVQTAHR